MNIWENDPFFNGGKEGDEWKWSENTPAGRAMASIEGWREERRKEVKVPGILDRVNFVVGMWQNPCGASWMVYLETMWPAFLDMLIMLSLAGWEDVIRGYARPGPLQRRHRARGDRKKPTKLQLKWRKARGWLPIFGEPAGEIGKRLPGGADMRSRYVTDGVRHMWMIDGLLQRLLWWFLVVDAVTTFLYRWTTLLHRTEACQKTQTAWASATHDDLFIMQALGWHGFHCDQNVASHNGASAKNGAITHPSAGAVVTSGGNFKPNDPENYPNATCQLRTVDAYSGQPLDYSSHTTEIEGSGAITVAQMPKGLAVYVENRAQNGGIRGTACVHAVNGPIMGQYNLDWLLKHPSEL